MSKAETYCMMMQRYWESMNLQYALVWHAGADEIAWREESAGRGEEFWSEVDQIQKENR